VTLAKGTRELRGARLDELEDKVARRVAGSRADPTVKAYRSNFAHFEDWCHSHGLAALPAVPETVALYPVAHEDVLKPQTLARRLAGIAKGHQLAGQEDPCAATVVKLTMAGVRRARRAPPRRSRPFLTEDIARAVGALDLASLVGRRDAVILLVGFAGGRVLRSSPGSTSRTSLG
jgi:site-specific recombinase XerD